MLVPSESESVICIFMFNPALLAQNIYTTGSSNAHTRLLLGGPHISNTCTLHICVSQCMDMGVITEQQLNISKYMEILSTDTKFKGMGWKWNSPKDLFHNFSIYLQSISLDLFSTVYSWRQHLSLPPTLYVDPTSLSWSGNKSDWFRLSWFIPQSCLLLTGY